MKRRNVIKQITASAVAIGATSRTFEPQTLGSEDPDEIRLNNFLV